MKSKYKEPAILGIMYLLSACFSGTFDAMGCKVTGYYFITKLAFSSVCLLKITVLNYVQ